MAAVAHYSHDKPMARAFTSPVGVLTPGWSNSTPREPEKQQRPPRRWLVVQGATLLVAASVTVFALLTRGVIPEESPAPVTPVAQGLPKALDYHGLLVASDNPLRVLLGTHDGVYESSNAGQTWRKTTLTGSDAMSLALASDSTVWASGHDVLALSDDGGETWSSVMPQGLPTLDIHAFAVDPADSSVHYAAIAGHGLYRSTDGGTSFDLVSDDVGASVVSLVLTHDGELLASDSERGLMKSSDGGRTWEQLMTTRLLGLAVNPAAPDTVLAAGPGVLLSWDGGRSFKQVLDIAQGAGSVAWAPSNADVGYALGLDGVLYLTTDRGATWQRAA
jgi:photosystem II stability/assembly factor-like uncharacterized protein